MLLRHCRRRCRLLIRLYFLKPFLLLCTCQSALALIPSMLLFFNTLQALLQASAPIFRIPFYSLSNNNEERVASRSIRQCIRRSRIRRESYEHRRPLHIPHASQPNQSQTPNRRLYPLNRHHLANEVQNRIQSINA